MGFNAVERKARKLLMAKIDEKINLKEPFPFYKQPDTFYEIKDFLEDRGYIKLTGSNGQYLFCYEVTESGKNWLSDKDAHN